MNELSIEQKAKAYDNALEIAKGLYAKDAPDSLHLERMFPVLKESEDERMELLNYLYDVHDDDEERARWIAWLETQGEHANFRNKIQIGDKVTRNRDGMLVNLSQLKRVAKPADEVEPKFHEGDTIIHKELGGDYIHNPHKIIQVDILDKKYRLEGGVVAHFSEQEDYELVEQKPIWSEEDEARFESCIEVLQTSDGYDTINAKWLKSLKDRVQPQNKWKESLATADLENSLCNIQDGFSDTSYEYRTLGEAIEFIRCTELKSQWKPSDEQMGTLRSVVTELKHSDNKYQETIEDLYQDLKKLMEK